MLSKEEIRERAEYCYLVFHQLSCLRGEEGILPHEYLKRLEGSSLKLAEDPFICAVIEEDIKLGTPDGGLNYLTALYEGFTHAYCEVIEMKVEDLRDSIPADLLRKLATEVSAGRRKRIFIPPGVEGET
ncbi:MAG TPA: hypothetical protein PK836_06735 [Syntrophales bacterium]|nr:hypothetical protein [Syntrophales bacterium]HOM07180.1 hypothetical protein [Syntrophales bacterium]HOO00439.1 hypothetical protein [Syntrophales bacterium]HPC01369.1 hypothetical protein [Syntrophales bacterium]HPQ06741.1 hypothetical protein [Syntrophales bacterium]